MSLRNLLTEQLILPLSDLVTGQRVYRDLRRLRHVETWTPEQLQSFQQQRLRILLRHIATEVPFYRDWFRSNGLNPETVTLQELPIVSKATMRGEGTDRFAAERFSLRELIASRSSGSTGEPFSFFTTREATSLNTAAKLRTWQQAGYRLGDRYMKIANSVRPSRLKRLQDAANNCLFVPFYSIDDSVLASILDTIEQKRPQFLRSYPAPLQLLARYRNSHPGYSHRLRRVFTTGSTLPDAYRQEIERAFGCDVIDSYSCEGTPNTYETTAHDGYRVSGYNGIIEVLDSDGQPIADGIGRVVSTDLWNLAHPFIRYDTQDLVEVHAGQIQRIMGRECESLVAASGKILTVHNFTHYFADNFKSIDSWQVVIDSRGGLTFRLVTDRHFTEADKQQIVDHWQPVVASPTHVEIVDALPLYRNNKRLSIIHEP